MTQPKQPSWYRIEVAGNFSILAKQVDDLMAAGVWVPLGAPAFVPEDPGMRPEFFMQALIYQDQP